MENQPKNLTFNRLPILGSTKVSFDEWKFAFDHWCKTYKVTEETEKIDYLFAITEGTARTIVYNSLNKETPDNYDTIISNLGKHFKKTSSKNSRILELSSITIRKDESISDFDLRFSDLLNQVNKTVTMNEVIITSYYINAFRSWTKIYENLMEDEPTTLEAAMKITSKKEKIMNLIKENKSKINSKEKSSNLKITGQTTNNYPTNYTNKNVINNNKNFSNNFNKTSDNNYRSYNFGQNKKIIYGNNYNNNRTYNNNEQNKNNYYYNNKLVNETKDNQKKNEVNNEIEEITKKLSDLKINFCINYMRIGHVSEECLEKESTNEHLN